MFLSYVYLLLAIITEIIGTIALKETAGLSKWIPTVIVIIGYGLSFYFLALAMNRLPIGITYAIWSGLGIVIIFLYGLLYYKEVPDLASLIGTALILLGVLVINLFSKINIQH